jgi:hypothetical protein
MIITFNDCKTIKIFEQIKDVKLDWQGVMFPQYAAVSGLCTEAGCDVVNVMAMCHS